MVKNRRVLGLKPGTQQQSRADQADQAAADDHRITNVNKILAFKFRALYAYAGTISRSGQRFVNAVAAGNPEFILFSLDVGEAFAKGVAFKEFSALIGTDLRAVQFDVERGSGGVESPNPATEALVMLKPMYGLKVLRVHGTRNYTRC